jgi:pyrimidine-nucleoside phosphorylase
LTRSVSGYIFHVYIIRLCGEAEIMRMYDIILKKRDGKKLSREEIEFFISGYVKEDIPDYQASAFLMAIYFCGMDDEETFYLTDAMARSGEMADLASLGAVADKHSTGGVADTTTLIVVPLVAACGLKVAKMSGRGLGHTGGTLDKLESIPGMDISLTMDAFLKQINTVGAAVMGQTMKLCPADKMLYSLRDVTATVESIPLIASSIMSKKLASGANIIMLDVKTGSGAFMGSFEDSKALAEKMVSIGKRSGRNTAALITDMSQPLGNAVGNALEVAEAIEILQEKATGDLLTVSMALASGMLTLAGIAESESAASDMLAEALASGRALFKLGEIISAQGGNANVVRDVSLLPRALLTENVYSDKEGVLSSIDCRGLGTAAGLLGAGRLKKDDTIDLSVGFIMKKRLGDRVNKGDALCEVHANDRSRLAEAKAGISGCLTIADSAKVPRLVYEHIV